MLFKDRITIVVPVLRDMDPAATADHEPAADWYIPLPTTIFVLPADDRYMSVPAEILKLCDADIAPVDAVSITVAPDNDSAVVAWMDVVPEDKIADVAGIIEAVAADKTNAPGVDSAIDPASSVNAPVALNDCVVPDT